MTGLSAKRRKLASPSESAPEAWSYDRLWDAQQISVGWHSRNIRFWRSQSADVRGVTGGGVSKKDLEFSQRMLADLVQERGGKNFDRVLDCGAGIGRVTAAVLRRHSAHVDLVEFVKKHLQKARQSLTN